MVPPNPAIAIVALLLVALPAPAEQGPGNGEAAGPPPARPDATKPEAEELGNGRYRVGRIEVDPPNGRFTVPGVVLRDEPPLEFFAVIKGGFKAYESLVELDANAYQFNLSCLLIGLDPGRGKAPAYHFDPRVVEGDRLEIWVAFDVVGKQRRVEAGELIRWGEKNLSPGGWIYTGSSFAPDGNYLAQSDGTLIGFSHDPSSVIEHSTGIGLGNYGAVGPNKELLPEVGAPLLLTVQRRSD